MGQYHHPVCIEAEECINPYEVGGGLKEGEQGFTRPSTPSALVALVCARGGNMPADCSQSAVVGRWAGKRVLVQGDYAEDTDIPNWDGPPLSTLYDLACGEKYREEGHNYWTDVSAEVAGFLEAACNVRFFGEDGWRDFVRVKPTGKHFGNCGIAEYVLDDSYGAEGLAYLKRSGMRPIDVQRVPRSGDWHGIRPDEIAEGQTRVIVNLDTLEYIDPVKFGQAPTLAGMVNSPPTLRSMSVFKKVAKGHETLVDVAGGLFAMLCHPERRGGGDLPATASEMRMAFGGNPKDPRAKKATLFEDCGDVKGRWRGGHILGTCELRHEDVPTTEEVIERGTDISEKVIKYLVAVSHY